MSRVTSSFDLYHGISSLASYHDVSLRHSLRSPIPSLDTPGVIDRVSSLFRGFPSLIVGFNTFLPAGYKIEVTNDALGQSYTITTPHSVHQQRHALGPPPTVATLQAQQQAAIVAQQQATNVGAQQKQQQQHVGMTASAQASGSSSFGAAPAIGAPVQAASNIAKKPPIEFNHAINYVNKIKVGCGCDECQ